MSNVDLASSLADDDKGLTLGWQDTLNFKLTETTLLAGLAHAAEEPLRRYCANLWNHRFQSFLTVANKAVQSSGGRPDLSIFWKTV